MKRILMSRVIFIDVVVKAKNMNRRTRVQWPDGRVVRSYPITLKAGPTVALNVASVACTGYERCWEQGIDGVVSYCLRATVLYRDQERVIAAASGSIPVTNIKVNRRPR